MPDTTTLTDPNSLITDARLLIAAGSPWLAPAALSLPVHPVTGEDATSSTSRNGAIHLAVDAVAAEARSTGTAAVHVGAVHLMTCLWRVLLGADERHDLLTKESGTQGTDAVAWTTAADAVCCRTAVSTALHTDAGVRYLPRAAAMVTPHTLAEAVGIDDPDHIGIEELYQRIKQQRQDSDESPSDGDGDAAEGQNGGGDTKTPPPPFTTTADPQSGPGMDDAALEHLRDQVTGAAAGAARAGDGESVPQAAADLAAARGHGELDLMSHFRTVLGAKVAAADPGPQATYRRAPRVDDPALIFPGRSHSVRRLMVALDTSPSMSDEQLARSAGECAAVALSRGFQVDYVSVAGSVSPVQRLERGQSPALVRGETTDMRAGFAAFDEHRPDAAVMLTDGETAWPEAAPRTRHLMIAIVPGPSVTSEAGLRHRVRAAAAACPWATVVALPVYQGQ